MGSGFSKMKKQARMLEDQLGKMREDMEKQEIEGSAGGKLVQVVIDGDKRLKRITINPECVDREDIEGLQDLIQGALEDAYSKVKEDTSLVGGLDSIF